MEEYWIDTFKDLMLWCCCLSMLSGEFYWVLDVEFIGLDASGLPHSALQRAVPESRSMKLGIECLELMDCAARAYES